MSKHDLVAVRAWLTDGNHGLLSIQDRQQSPHQALKVDGEVRWVKHHRLITVFGIQLDGLSLQTGQDADGKGKAFGEVGIAPNGFRNDAGQGLGVTCAVDQRRITGPGINLRAPT